MTKFIERNPLWALILLVALAFALWLVFASWPQGFEDVFGKKKLFLNAVLNGITLGGLYFLVASGFTLIFGLMRNVNLAHGSLYLFGGYMGYEAGDLTGSWLFGYVIAFISCAIVGIAMQFLIFRRMEGQDLRQTLVTLGLWAAAILGGGGVIAGLVAVSRGARYPACPRVCTGHAFDPSS